VSERRIRELFHDTRAPNEEDAEQRSCAVVKAASKGGEHVPMAPRWSPLRVAMAALALAALGAVALSPAGAAVGDWVSDVVKPGRKPAEKALVSLPAPGRLLVTSDQGPWVVQQDGSKRLLGRYDDASWSPHGLYLVATTNNQVVALEPNGHVRWSLGRAGPVRRARWSPDGFRIAYLDRQSLRVVAGDGTGDRALVQGVAPAAPAWRPGTGHILAFADWHGRVRVIRADSRKLLWRSSSGDIPVQLSWSADGRRLVAIAGHGLRVFNERGALVQDLRLPSGARVERGAFSPSGNRLAVIRYSARGRKSKVVLIRTGSNRSEQHVFSGVGRFSALAWSPSGRWLLLAWRDADQWLFIRSAAVRKVEAVSNISRQFNPGAQRPPAFPDLGGWCCPSQPVR
jgi:dipeptidyl aminopeptidase/acylaminoacyl peptidase